MKKNRLTKTLRLPSTKLSLFELVWLFAPIAVWFSYQPLIRLGEDRSMNFELSITVIYTLLLAIVSLPTVWRSKRKLSGSKEVLLVTCFVFVSAVSVIWSADRTRGLLTLGVIGLLYVIFLAAFTAAGTLKKLLPALTQIFIGTAVLMSVLSFVQVIAGIWLTRDQALLCRACTAVQFGFARPNVFTIEPQFFANLLLVPAIVLIRRILTTKQGVVATVSAGIIVAAIFLSLSRGAILAFGAGLLILLVFTRPTLKRFFVALGILVTGFIVGLATQGLAAVMNPSIDTSFFKAVNASINQLSLGVIDLQSASQETVQSQLVTPAPSLGIAPTEVVPNFDGYVAESTNVRLKLSGLALQSWAKSPERIVFGVGLGGSGVVLRQDFPTQVNEREIVQNEYVEILLENGIIGLLLFAAIIGALLFGLRQTKWLWVIVAMFLVQWNFFSGYPNALHIYLVLILLLVLFGIRSGDHKTAN